MSAPLVSTDGDVSRALVARLRGGFTPAPPSDSDKSAGWAPGGGASCLARVSTSSVAAAVAVTAVRACLLAERERVEVPIVISSARIVSPAAFAKQSCVQL
jgi:hypothetical protein